MQLQMRRVWFIAALLFGASSPTFAQDISIVPALRAGDAFQLEVIRIRENSAQPQQNSKSTSRVDVRVLSASADGSVIEWVPGVAVFDKPQAAMNPVVGAASQALRDIRFRLRLSADGELQEMTNQADVVPKLKAVVDVVISQLSASLPEDQRKGVLNLMGQILNVDVLIATAIRDAATYLGLNGISLAAGEAAEVDLEQPSPLGGGTIPAKFRVRMDSANPERASLSTTTTYDPAALLRMTENVSKQAGSPIPPEELAKLPPMTMSDEGTFVFDRTLGLMREVKVSRRISLGPTSRLDAWEIRLVSGPR